MALTYEELYEIQEKSKKKKKKKQDDDIAPVLTNKSTPVSSLVPRIPTSTEMPDLLKKYTPVAPTVTTSKKKDDRTWFQKGALEDGDWSKAILGSITDISENIGTGIIGTVEKAVDFLTMAGTAMNRANMNQANFNMMSSPYALTKKGNEYARGLVATNNALQKESEKVTSDFVKKDLYDEEKIAKKIISAPVEKRTGIDVEASSVLGERSDALIQSGGQMLATIGLQAAGVPWFLTTGATTFGAESENALKEGASFDEAIVSSAVSAGAEILTEQLSGGIKFGGNTLDDVLIKPFTEQISNKVIKKLVDLGVDITGEAFEEWITEDFSRLGQWLTYQDEKSFKEMFLSKEAMEAKIEAAIGGGVLGGTSNVVRAVASRNAVELTENEQKVFDKVVEERIAEEKADGKKVNKKKEAEIRKAVLNEMLKGYIDTDTIESVLGGEEYENYKYNKDLTDENIASGNKVLENLQKTKDTLQAEYDALYKMKNGEKSDEQIDRQSELKEKIADLEARIEKTTGIVDNLGKDERLSGLKTKLGQNVFDLVKDSRLAESYKENARSGEDFQPDFEKFKGTKHEDAARKTLENAVKAGANNTNKVRDLVESNAKFSAEHNVVFEYKTDKELKQDFIDRQTEEIAKLEKIPEEQRTEEQIKELAELKNALEEVQSGKKKVNGNVTDGVITLNLDSPELLEVTSGHEITHLFEGAKSYAKLQKAVFAYAKTKGVDIDQKLAERKGTYQGVRNTTAEKELTADLVGEYIFTDYDFIKSLSVENKGLFHELWDSVKYLCKITTAGSKEARQLEKVKRQFEKAYKESAKVEGTKNSLSSEQESYFKDSKVRDENGNLKVMYHGTSKGGHTVFDTYGSNYGLFGQGSYFTDNKSVAESYTNKGNGNNKQVYETYLNITNPIDMDAQADVNAWAKALPDADFSNCTTNEDCYRAMEEYFEDEQYSKYEASEIAMDVMQSMGYDGITHIGGGRRTGTNDTSHRVYIAFEPEQIKNIDNIAPTKDADIRYSLTEDSEGNKLTENQSKYFRNAKTTDENGRLKALYHGSRNPVFTEFITQEGVWLTDDSRYADVYATAWHTWRDDLDDAPVKNNSLEKEVYSDPDLRIYKMYANITNPVDVGEIDGTIDDDFVDNLIRVLQEGTSDQSSENLLYIEEDIKGYLDEWYGYPAYNFTRSEDFINYAAEQGFDGIKATESGRNTWCAFNAPNQVKLTSNKNPTADADVRYSLSTEYTPQAKSRKTMKPTNSNLQKDMWSVRDVRSKTMLENNYTQADVEQINKFMDNLATFMEKAGVTYKFIGLEDVNNAKVKVVYDTDGTPKRITMSAMVKNGEYPVNFDFTTICKKRQSMSMVIEELARRKNGDGTRELDEIDLDAKALWTINEELRKAGLETACLGCFVESKRYNIQNFANKATTMWNSIVDEIRQEQGNTQPVEKFNFAEGVDLEKVNYSKVDKIFRAYRDVKGRTSPEKRMRALIKNGGEVYQKYLQPSDLMTPEGIEGLKSLSTNKNDFYGIIKGVYGQAAPKEVMSFSPYNSEIALLPDKKGKNMKMAEYIAKIGGVRMQSFSDFIVSNVYDYMQMVADLSAKHLPAHAYTKEIAFAKIFGKTGIKINMSVMFDIDASLSDDYAGLQFVPDTNGTEEYEGVKGRFEYLVADQKRSDKVLAETGERPYVQSIGFDEAVKLQNMEGYSGNIGIIGVGYSDNHIIKMLRDNNIRYVIPYHSSSLPSEIKAVTNISKAKDYTEYQNTKTKSGDALIGLGGFDIYKDVAKTNNPKQTAKNYLDYCKSKNYTPVFPQFAEEENYYKLLFDFDPYDTITGEYSPQTEVKNIYEGYNPEKGFTSTKEIERLIEEEMKIQNEANRQRNTKISAVVDNVLEQLGVENDKVGFSLSDANETPKDYGNFGVYGKDFRVKGRPTDIAPIQQTVSKTERVEGVGTVNEDDYAPMTEEQALRNAEADRDYINSFTDADMPPEIDAPIYSPDTSSVDEKALKNISAMGRDVLLLNAKERRMLEGIVQKYSTSEDQSNTTLFNEIKKVFGEKSYTERIEEVAEVRQALRGYKINVSPSIKRDIADYTQFMRRNFGKIIFSKEGMPVDTAYMELSATYPDFFPSDIVNPSDQLQQMSEVANLERETTNTFELDDDVIQEATDVIQEAVGSYKEKQMLKSTQSDSKAILRDELSKDKKTANQRKIKQQQYKTQMEELVGDTSTWVDKKLGISYGVNTLRRNLRDIVRDANGKRDIAKADAIYDELQGKYNHNEAELNRESTQIKQPFADMNITKAEDTYIQMLGEFRHNPETTLTEDVVKEFYEKHKKHINEAKVDKVIAEARTLYDDLLVRVNQVLSEQGMKEIPYRKGYFPHFTEEKQGFLAKLFNWKTQNNDIPTDIAGLTENFNPNRSWQSFNKQRKGDTTDYSFLKGLDSYVQGSLDWIYHIEDLQKRRALENHIRYTHSEQGIKDKVNAILNSEEYDAEEMQEQIDLVYKEASNPLNNFVTDFRMATNTLAGKKSSLDRSMETLTNRKFYSTMTNLSNRVSANMVAGSVSSAFTNFIPITQSWGQVSPISSLRAMGETIASTFRDDGTINKSDFLTNRLRKAENLYKTNWDKVGEGVGFLMEAIDGFTSQTVWRSKYNENISKGMSENEAIKNADQFAENVLAGRSRGNNPTIFDSKNPLIKTLTVFQLEVNNQYGYMFKDMPQDVAKESKAKLVTGYATMFLGAYAYNALYSSLVGRDAAFDPIGIIEDLLRDLGLLGDDDEEEEEIAPVDAVLNLTNNLLQEAPFVGGLLGGGRIPLSSALPYDGNMFDFAKDISEKNVKTITNEWLKPVYYLAMPMGGGQLRKTVQGLNMFSDDHPVTGSYTDSGSLRFPVEDTPLNRIQAGIFGQYANENARTYFDEGYAPLKEKQIQEYKDVDMPIADYWKYREGLAGLKNLKEKGDYIGGLDLPISKKNILINNIADRETPIDMTDYNKYSDFEEFDFATRYPEKYAVLQQEGISVKEYKEKYEETAFMYTDDFSWAANNPEKYTFSKAITDNVLDYREITSELYAIRADKDSNGKTINGSAKKKKKAYIWSLDIDDGAKYILFKNEYNSVDDYNDEIVDYLNSRDDITYDEMNTILEQLGAKVDDEGYISW